MSVLDGRYKDIPSIILENDFLRVSVLSQQGSKVASLVYKPLGYETLWQNPSPRFAKVGYGGMFTEGEMAGFDEMFPTISRCFCEQVPWYGQEFPDHGEVWSIPWEPRIENTRLCLRVSGVRFPYRLEKQIWLEGRCLQIEYTCQNTSSYDFDCIWAAHPLFNTEEGMKFLVPEGMNRIVNSVPAPRLGQYGYQYDFPDALLPGGEQFRLDVMPKRNNKGFQKYWFLGQVPQGWCVLYYPSLDLSIGLSYPHEVVPYLGVFANEGGFAGQYNFAPEPATGGMDRVDFARMWGMSSALKPMQTKTWFLNLSIAPGLQSAGVDARGRFR